MNPKINRRIVRVRREKDTSRGRGRGRRRGKKMKEGKKIMGERGNEIKTK